MLYTILAYDKKDSLNLRLNTRKTHLDYLQKHIDKIIFAGPILNNNQEPIGSNLILDFKTYEELENFLKNDPYALVNLFDTVIINSVKMVINNYKLTN